MTVVSAVIMDVALENSQHQTLLTNLSTTPLSKKALSLVAKSINVNSSASMVKDKNGNDFMQGSKTEIALLNFFHELGYFYTKDRETTKVLDVLPFSSESKRMSCKINEPIDQELTKLFNLDTSNQKTSTNFVFVKGASEIILKLCTKYMTSTGTIVPMSDEMYKKCQSTISEYASNALRTISCALKPLVTESDNNAELKDVQHGLILVGLFGILDPLRPEVTKAVSDCKDAGIMVRMVTGDGTATARAIAKQCGILNDDGIVMEGPEFRKLSEMELDKVLPKLQVLARSSPLDKQILVRNLKRLGETVAVTGGIF